MFNHSSLIIYEKCQIKIFHNDTNGAEHTSVLECTNGYKYTLDKLSTIATEFDLICDRSSLAELLQTLVMVGQLIGAAFASSLSDRVGRKTVHLCSNFLTLVFGISVGFAPNYTTLAILKFILGVLIPGMILPAGVFTLELFPEKTRFVCEIMGSMFWTTGLVIMSGIAYLLQDYSWRYLQIVLSCFSLLSLIQYWVQDESLRWLIVNGKTKEVDRILLKVSRWNKIDYRELKANLKKKMNVSSKEKPDYEESLLDSSNKLTIVEKYSFLTILQNKSVLLISLLVYFAWFTVTLTYYSLTLTSTSLVGNRFLNFFFSVCVEYIALFIEYPMLFRFGRRTVAILFLGMAGTFLALATLFNYFSDGNQSFIMLSVIATFAGKMSVGGAFSVLFLFTPELFPTNLRNLSFGMCSAVSRIGGIISPFAGTLATHIPWAPGMIFSIMCFGVTIIILYLPETRGIELPQTLGEVKLWYAENGGFQLRKFRNKNKHTSETMFVLTN